MMKQMAASYGCDISRPAANVQEAIQATYFGYLSAVKEQNGAAMSLGRTSTFLDVYAERDLALGTFTEEQIQEFVDHFIMKLSIVRFARTPEYNDLFSRRSCLDDRIPGRCWTGRTPSGDKNVLPLI